MPTTDATAPLYAIKAELFKALAHPTRIQSLEVLAAAADHRASVGALLAATGAEPSQLSQHLAVLKKAGVVTSTREGSAVTYRLSQPLVAELLVVARAFLRARLGESTAQLAVADTLPALHTPQPDDDAPTSATTSTPGASPAPAPEATTAPPENHR